MSGFYDDEDYGDYDAERECEHEHYEIDVCTGRASCDYCNHFWYLTSDEIDHALDRQERYYEDMERENRRQWWRDLRDQILSPFRWLRWRRRPKLDDDIPF